MSQSNTLTILRNFGNRFRRPGAPDDDSLPGTLTDAPSFAQGLLNPKRPSDPTSDPESPDLYYEDRPLGLSIHALEQVRAALRHLSKCANDHAAQLVASANAQRALGEALTDAMTPSVLSDAVGGPEFGDLAIAASVRTAAPDENGENLPHFAACLPVDAVEAQTALGDALANHSQVVVKLSNALTAPINDLARSFEERYTRKIVPLRRRYVDQKGQYLKCKRNADMADTDEKRSYYEALADAAKPVWLRTSTELRTEADVMTNLTASKMALWSKSLAKQHERALAIAAANFAEAFTRANQLPPLS